MLVELASGFARRRSVAIQEYGACPLALEAFRDCAANALCTATDDGHPAGKSSRFFRRIHAQVYLYPLIAPQFFL